MTVAVSNSLVNCGDGGVVCFPTLTNPRMEKKTLVTAFSCMPAYKGPETAMNCCLGLKVLQRTAAIQMSNPDAFKGVTAWMSETRQITLCPLLV